jgi:HSP20 family molecular chaperone IbpA
MSNAIEPGQATQPAQAQQRTQSAESARRIEWRVPAVDVYENDDAFLILADLPGVGTSDLVVRTEHDALLVEGRRGDNLGWRREFTLPPTVDGEKISAELANGVLRLVLPRAERSKPRRIEIK